MLLSVPKLSTPTPGENQDPTCGNSPSAWRVTGNLGCAHQPSAGACKAGRESIVRQIRLDLLSLHRAGTGNSTMALSAAPEMSQLLEAATRLFLFMCHSLIEESSSRKSLPKKGHTPLLALPTQQAGGFGLPELLCWVPSDSISSGETWEAVPGMIQQSYYDNKEISGRKLLTNPLCLR